MLKEGNKAVYFELPDENGNKVNIGQFKGKKIVLYFYPKDDTPGCTKEACSFRDIYDQILEKGAVVIGISKDNEKSHTKFKQKYNLPFYLLSDTSGDVIEAYGAFGQKAMMGKSFMGIIRSTFIIGEDQTIIKVFPKVKPEEHAQEVLGFLN